MLMKYYVLAVLFAFLASCKPEKQKGVPDNAINPDVMKNPATASGKAGGDLPTMIFAEDTHNFGQIVQGEKVSYTFNFKNTGKADLVISSASGSCGCTVPEYPKTAVPPGATGYVKVTFDSSGKQGQQDKTVTLYANTVPNSKILHITATVDIPEDK
jgi:hypothetical protein